MSLRDIGYEHKRNAKEEENTKKRRLIERVRLNQTNNGFTKTNNGNQLKSFYEMGKIKLMEIGPLIDEERERPRNEPEPV